MKKLKKINLELNKEVIFSLSGNEMNNVKGGTNLSYDPNLICTGTMPTTTIPIETGATCAVICKTDDCPAQTGNTCLTNGANICELNPTQGIVNSCAWCAQ